ncbi:MAG: YdcF family protein, partial [Patescibacteria group bacterium]
MEEKEKEEKEIEESDLDTILEFLGKETPIDILPETEAIFVFGHYQPLVAQHATELWKKKKGEKIILTGKGGSGLIPKTFNTEAEYFASILTKAGIPEQSLILEKESSNVLENVKMGIMACHAIGFFPKTLVLCALPPLLLRTHATFQKQFPEIAVYGSAFPMPSKWFTDTRMKRLLGEFDRLKNYAKKGDISYVEIPEKVLLAKENIRKALMP